MLTLENFEQVLDKEILKRGRSYYKDGHISELVDDDAGGWTATVVGSDYYTVEITPDAEEGLATSCTCPYEFSLHCKHVAAVFYAIRDLPKHPKPPEKGSKQGKVDLRKLLEGLTQDQLIGVILEVAKQDKAFANNLRLQFSDTPPDKTLYVQVIMGILRKERGRDSYLGYMESQRVGTAVQRLLDDAEKRMNAGEVAKVLPILEAVIETMPHVFVGADDSAGELGGTLEGTFELFEQAIVLMSPEQQETFFGYCLDQATDSRYAPLRGMDYDAGRFIDLAAGITADAERRDRLFAVMDKWLAQQPEGWSKQYSTEFVVHLKNEILERLEVSEGERLVFLQQYAYLPAIRQQLVGIAMRQGDYDRVAEMCTTAIKEYQKDKPGLVAQYRNTLIEIAKKQGKPDALIKLAEEQFLDTTDFAHYQMLKSTIPAAQWDSYLQQLIDKIGTNTRWNSAHILGEIYQREGKWRALLTLAQAQPEIALRFRHSLEEHFPEVMLAMYERIARRDMAGAGGRGEYQQVTQYLRWMLAMGEEERAYALVEEFKQLYPKRRAMIEELAAL